MATRDRSGARATRLLSLLVAGLVLAGCARLPGSAWRPALLAPRPVPGQLSVPPGPGPFPAVVLLHGCAGVTSNVFEWARRLTAERYVTLVVDSHGPRGVRSNCLPADWGGRAVWVADVADDAFAAHRYLRSLPFVDRRRVAVMGFSYGAQAALRTTSAGYLRRRADYRPFKAAVALYPSCSGSHPDPVLHENLNHLYDDVYTPLLLLMGELDDEALPASCTPIAERLREQGKPVFWKVYPGATHFFDLAELGSRTLVNDAGPWGMFTYRYSPEVTDAATRKVLGFLGRHLKSRPPERMTPSPPRTLVPGRPVRGG